MKVRLRFSKLGKIRWTSHRDVARMWERAFRRLALPLAYTAGFSHRPKVSFGLALSTGHESLAEYLDIDLEGDAPLEWPLAELPERLSGALPDGLNATAAVEIDPGTPSLQELVTSCDWAFSLDPAVPDLRHRVETLLSASTAVVKRRRKGAEVWEDIRPSVLDLHLIGVPPASSPRLQAELACQPRSIRAADVVAALGAGLEERDVCRMNQWILRLGARDEPVPLAGFGGATGATRRDLPDVRPPDRTRYQPAC
ncbi:MAG: TIGR03936 family radical SAM-associated protein [Acidimicrobiales bacterium]